MEMMEHAKTCKHVLPSLVIAADWSTDERKRWMVRADRVDSCAYIVYPPEPVGDKATLISRLRSQIGENESLLIGFDFPIGLPVTYAQRVGVTSFRKALSQFGSDQWERFYTISDSPNLRQPFFPLPTQKSGDYRNQLAKALGCQDLSPLRRRCDLKTGTRRAAECLFFTIGGAQVGAAAIVGWRDVIQPSLGQVKLWPFDGDLSSLLSEEGLTIAEIYPAEAYLHLGVQIGSGTGLTKALRDDRREAAKHWSIEFNAGQIRLCAAAQSWVQWGFRSEDDFDAMAGLLSMLQIVTGQRTGAAPDTVEVKQIEGWILGQEFSEA
jgi:hypothetical protein